MFSNKVLFPCVNNAYLFLSVLPIDEYNDTEIITISFEKNYKLGAALRDLFENSNYIMIPSADALTIKFMKKQDKSTWDFFVSKYWLNDVTFPVVTDAEFILKTTDKMSYINFSHDIKHPDIDDLHDAFYNMFLNSSWKSIFHGSSYTLGFINNF